MALVVRDANERMERLIASLLALASSEGGHRADAQRRPRRDRGARARPRGGVRRRRRAAARGRARAPRRSSATPSCSSAWPRTSSRTRSATTPPSAGCGCAPGSSAARRSCTSPTPASRIDPTAVEELLEPFRRLESSRSRSTGGYGLGLAVVRAVAQAHGGRVAVLARREGGLEVTVSLPMASAAAGEPIASAPAAPRSPPAAPCDARAARASITPLLLTEVLRLLSQVSGVSSTP